MNYRATIDIGLLELEVQGAEREVIESEIIELVHFIKENEDKLDLTTESLLSLSESSGSSADSQPETDTSVFSSITDRTRVSSDILAKLFEIPEDEAEPPYIRTFEFEEESEVLGSSRKDRQARGSLILLYLWKECLGVEEVDSENLNAALSYSDISPERRDAMYSALEGKADNFFNRNGILSLTPPGEHAARDEIKALSERFEEQNR